MPALSAGALPGTTNMAWTSGVSTSRMAGRSVATIGRLAAMYSNSFKGEVKRVEIAEGGFGSTEDGCLRQERPNVRRIDEPGEPHSRCDAQLVRKRSDTCEIGFLRVPADDQPVSLRNLDEGFEQHIDALPRIQMSRVHDERTIAGTRDLSCRP